MQKKYCWECTALVSVNNGGSGFTEQKFEVCDKTEEEMKNTGHSLKEPCKKK